MWQWASISPGITTLPVASMTWRSSPRGTLSRVAPAPVAWIRSSFTSTPRSRCGGRPVPSMTVPPVMRVHDDAIAVLLSLVVSACAWASQHPAGGPARVSGLVDDLHSVDEHVHHARAEL